MQFKPQREVDIKFRDCGVRVFYYKEAKNCPKALILHGLRSDAARLNPVIKKLESRYSIIAPDMPGFGKSGNIGKFDNYIDYCCDFLDELILKLDLKPEELYLIGTSNGANIIIQNLLKHPDRKFWRICLLAPIYSYKYLSMSRRYKLFVYWFMNKMAKGGWINKQVQKIFDSDKTFMKVGKLLAKEDFKDPQIAEYEMRQWRLMTMQHWGKTLKDFLATDLTGTEKIIDQNDITLIYPRKDQYLQVDENINAFKKLIPNAKIEYLDATKHMPRGDFDNNPEFMKSIENLVSKL